VQVEARNGAPLEVTIEVQYQVIISKLIESGLNIRCQSC